MDGPTISTVTVHLEKDGVPLPQASVTAFNSTKQADDFGVVTFSNVTGGKQTFVVKDAESTYTLPVYVLSSDVEISLTNVQPTVIIPSQRQVAYQKAAGSIPLFIGMMIFFGFVIAVMVYFINKRFAFLPVIVRWFLQVALILVLLVAGIYVTAYASGSQDALFAMLSPAQSARASSDTIAPPLNVRPVSYKNSITLYWDINAEPNVNRTYLVRWGKDSKEVLQNTRITNAATTKLENLESGAGYTIEIQAIEIGETVTRLSNPVQLTVKTE